MSDRDMGDNDMTQQEKIKKTTLNFGLISDGCTSVTQSTCLAWALNELDLTAADQEQVHRVMNDADEAVITEPPYRIHPDCGCEGLDRFDVYLETMATIAQRYLPTGASLVLRVNGEQEDDWFGVEERQAAGARVRA